MCALFSLRCPSSTASEITHVDKDHLHRQERLTKTTAILGVVAIARSHVESIDEIEARLKDALCYIDRARLMAAPDCRLGLLSRTVAVQKLNNLCAAAHAA